MSINHEKLAESIHVKKQTKSKLIEPKKIGEFVSVKTDQNKWNEYFNETGF